MAAGGPVDPTMPLPDGDRRGAPQPPEAAEPTGTGALPGSYDPTVAVPPVGPPNEPGDPYGPGPGDDEGDNRKWLWGILAALGVIVLGVVIALLVTGGDDGGDKPPSSTSTTGAPSTTTSSSSSTTSTTPPTTTPTSPQITAYNATPSPANCPNAATTVQLTLTWTTVNALGVTVSIDGPGKYADYGANGSAQVPFPCSGSHSYTLTANGNNGQTATRTITVQPSIAPPTTSTTAAPPPSTSTTTSP